MNVKKCDRCGTIYEEINHHGGDFFQIYKNKRHADGLIECCDHVDLCPNCEKDLVNWFNNNEAVIEYSADECHVFTACTCNNCIYSKYEDLGERLVCHRCKPKNVRATNICNKWKEYSAIR